VQWRICVLVGGIVIGNCGAVHRGECLSTFALLLVTDLFTSSDNIGHVWTPDWLSGSKDELSLRTDSGIPWRQATIWRRLLMPQDQFPIDQEDSDGHCL
jgi:hypothetical protein